MNKTKIINKNVIINNVPLENITINQNTISLEFDDVKGKRFKAIFNPYQAVKITTMDCVNIDDFFNDNCLTSGYYQRYILEVENSEWINQLKYSLMQRDEDATFMDKARHFIFDLRDNLVEIIAWNLELNESL